MLKNIIVKCKTYKSLPNNKMYYGSIKTNEYGQMYLAYYLDNETPHICCIHFANGQTMETFSNDLKKRWSDIKCEENNKLTQEMFNNYVMKQQERDVYVVLNGTDFQMKVWAALLDIPYGEERTYGDVAAMIDSPTAVRAVATAVGSNNIALLIPCHRVKAKTGDMHKYRWGRELKKKILLTENKDE